LQRRRSAAGYVVCRLQNKAGRCGRQAMAGYDRVVERL